MNAVFLSPHFPPTFYLFCVRLREAGANVFGIGEEHFGNLRPELQGALTEHYRVENLNDFEEAARAIGHFSERHGRIDRIASHNEHWLELEAWLRQRFDIPGRKISATAEIKRKSLMKRRFREAAVEVAYGAVAETFDEARRVVDKTGYPVIAKPDQGVGAAATYKLVDELELREFFRVKPAIDYFIEGFVTGHIETFDGLCDHEGRVVFHMSLEYSRNIMEVVAEDDHVSYWTQREIPSDLVDVGTASVHAFGLREQFFHFEFFRTPEGRLLGLELNARPPGWPTIDIFNYANDADAYLEWAHVVLRRPRACDWSRRYHSIFIGRKNRFRYRHSHDEIVTRYGHLITQTLEMPQIFSGAMGQRAYLARAENLAELIAMRDYVQEKA